MHLRETLVCGTNERRRSKKRLLSHLSFMRIEITLDKIKELVFRFLLFRTHTICIYTVCLCATNEKKKKKRIFFVPFCIRYNNTFYKCFKRFLKTNRWERIQRRPIKTLNGLSVCICRIFKHAFYICMRRFVVSPSSVSFTQHMPRQ